MSGAALWEAFRRVDERGVLLILREREELRHVGGEMALRAACWYGMADVAKCLMERWGAEVCGELPGIARSRGHEQLAVWLDGIIRDSSRLIA
jgi:hypothetical protein